MVRVVQEMRIVEDERLIEQAGPKGERLQAGLCALAERPGSPITNVRGMGLYQGFTLPSSEHKTRLIEIAREEQDLLLLGAGADAIRTRPNLSVTNQDIDRFLELLARALAAL
jgi:L-lysine 6-transaminase